MPCEYCAQTPVVAPPSLEPAAPSTPIFDLEPHLSGIGGWLILVLVGMIIAPVVLLAAAWTDFHTLTGPNHALVSARMPGLMLLVGFELFANVTLFLGLAFLLFFFFREDRRFPRVYQLWLALSFAEKLAEYTLSFRIGDGSSWQGAQQLAAGIQSKLGVSVLQAVIAAVLWIWYFEVSRRVKATFVH